MSNNIDAARDICKKIVEVGDQLNDLILDAAKDLGITFHLSINDKLIGDHDGGFFSQQLIHIDPAIHFPFDV